MTLLWENSLISTEIEERILDLIHKEADAEEDAGEDFTCTDREELGYLIEIRSAFHERRGFDSTEWDDGTPIIRTHAAWVEYIRDRAERDHAGLLESMATQIPELAIDWEETAENYSGDWTSFRVNLSGIFCTFFAEIPRPSGTGPR